MDNKIPLPTDNIYKFYSLFGLFIFLHVCLLLLLPNNTYLERAFEAYEEVEILKSIQNPSPEQKVRIKILERKAEIDPVNKKVYMNIIGFGIGISIGLMFYGFLRWHKKIQPKQDEFLQKQIDKVDLEIRLLKKDAHKVVTNYKIR